MKNKIMALFLILSMTFNFNSNAGENCVRKADISLIKKTTKCINNIVIAGGTACRTCLASFAAGQAHPIIRACALVCGLATVTLVAVCIAKAELIVLAEFIECTLE